MKKDVLSYIWYVPVQKALISYTFNKSHLSSLILVVFPHVANFRYVANFTFEFLTLTARDVTQSNYDKIFIAHMSVFNYVYLYNHDVILQVWFLFGNIAVFTPQP